MKREFVGGKERVTWNPALALSSKAIELAELEVVRVKTALEMWDSLGAAADRHWLQPIVEALFSFEPPNHQSKSRRTT